MVPASMFFFFFLDFFFFFCSLLFFTFISLDKKKSNFLEEEGRYSNHQINSGFMRDDDDALY